MNLRALQAGYKFQKEADAWGDFFWGGPAKEIHKVPGYAKDIKAAAKAAEAEGAKLLAFQNKPYKKIQDMFQNRRNWLYGGLGLGAVGGLYGAKKLYDWWTAPDEEEEARRRRQQYYYG
jgi:hypothetical protein